MSTTDRLAGSSDRPTVDEPGVDRGIDDPITGPMPAVTMLDGRVRAHVHEGAVIVALDGGLDAAFAEEVAPVVAGAFGDTDAAVLDLDQVALLDRSGFDLVLAAFEEATSGAERCIVASRLSGRLVLERWGVTGRYAVFTSEADALQARAFATNGYGSGWNPEP